MSEPVLYSIDSSALLHAWRRAYRPKNFGRLWGAIDDLIEAGRLKASIEVLREMEQKDDEVHAWCKSRKDGLFVEIDDACQQRVGQLMAAYPRLVDTVKGRSGGDPFVIALASSGALAMSVISEEFPGKVRIPDVCKAEGIGHLYLADLIENEGWSF